MGTFLLLVSILSLFSFKVTTDRSIPLTLCYDDLGSLGLFLKVSKLYNELPVSNIHCVYADMKPNIYGIPGVVAVSYTMPQIPTGRKLTPSYNPLSKYKYSRLFNLKTWPSKK